jgi:multiple sugar transport system substrate-binding protein
MKGRSITAARWLGAGALSLGLTLPTVGISQAARVAHSRVAHPASAAATLQLANDKPTWASYFNAEGAAAAKAIGVNWKAVPYADTTTYQAAIRTSGRTSKAADLFTWWSGYLMTDIASSGLAQDTSSLWSQNASAYDPAVRAALTSGGKTYGAPLYTAYWVVFYNKHVFSKYGLEPPTTWAQFLALNKTLRGHGIDPLGATIDGRWPGFIYFESLLAGSDPSLYNKLMAGKAKYTDPGVVKVMTLWASMIKAGYFSNPAIVTASNPSSPHDEGRLFIQGKIAMMESGTWGEPTLIADGFKPGKDYGLFLMPNVTPSAGKIAIFETSPLMASAQGQHKDAAMKGLTYFMSKAGQQAWVKSTGFISARKDVQPTSAVDQQLSSTINQGHYTLLQRYWEATPHDIVEVAVDQFDKFLLHPNDEMSVLTTIQKQADHTWTSMR